MIIPYQDKVPSLGENVFIADGAKVVGNVTIGDYSSVWFNSVIRGDVDSVTIGRRVNIQDMTVIHENGGQPTLIEDDVTIGHSSILHGCTIRKGCLIGMGALILNDAEIGEYSMVAAGALVTERKVFPPRSLIMGSPAKVVRELSAQEIESIQESALRYMEKGQEYKGSSKK
ncbi:transferase hexapeptide repeat containing protein [Syntrophobotulus glycolicus DSM 8271]|uniref:Transferase hexapeptide repeat containing protein n=1 Tax=Syntrophobotulus glycolicus (strain DSM 8271 / FlGlyR) TaxID=645991 RepID=F0SXB1_SYNGF|nr:gamma carbonic anhydrase family protein [Syntrophobotulus glycolicus]ADY56971.1 transferase hexapeptide repeat containing protein [Syntrophobotulus glycolicus DSM 8271]